MAFADLLIHTCTIQQKTLNQDDYEQVEDWADLATGVPCRKDSSTGVKIQDGKIRLNTDDDLFFFQPTVTIKRGNRIILDDEEYDVVKVNKLYDRSALHHLEVIGRAVDNK